MNTINTFLRVRLSDRFRQLLSRAVLFLKTMLRRRGLPVAGGLLFILAGCEMYSDVLSRPEYKPTLILHGILSPQEGGEVYVKYTLPIDTSQKVEIPALPALSVFLYEDGEKKVTFTSGEKGHFVLEKEALNWHMDREYHIEAADETGRVLLKSAPERLPAPPEMRKLRFYQDSSAFPEKNYIDAEIDFTGLPGSSLHFRKDYSIDGGETFMRGRNEEYGRFSLRELYASGGNPKGTLREVLPALAFMRARPDGANEWVNFARLWVDHLSPALTRFLKEVADMEEADGDPFAVRNPIYSNIEGGAGIFGLYNSAVETIRLE